MKLGGKSGRTKRRTTFGNLPRGTCFILIFPRGRNPTLWRKLGPGRAVGSASGHSAKFWKTTEVKVRACEGRFYGEEDPLLYPRDAFTARRSRVTGRRARRKR